MLPMFPAHPESLHGLFTETNPLAKYFRANIRLFNSGMAMASVMVTEKTVLSHGPASFKVCGQMHRLIGPMLQQNDSTPPTCMQTYFHDPEYQAAHRANRNARGNISQNDIDKRTAIFHTLHRIIAEDCHNSYLQSFLSVNEYIQREGINPEEVQIQLCATERPQDGHHAGRYHLPTALEVALLKDVNPPVGAHRSIVCSVRQRQLTNDDRKDLKRFQDYHRSYTPLTYPLLFPHGTDGWTLGIRSLSSTPQDKNVTIMSWLRFHMMARPTHFNFLHSARKLYQQYIVDEFERHHTSDMGWMVHNQKTLRADLCRGL